MTRVELQEIPQLTIIYEIWLQPTSRRFLRELDEAPGGNNLCYILQCLRVPASVARVWTRKVCWVATECSRNNRSKTQYYVVILDRLQGRSGALERAPESRIRDPLTCTSYCSLWIHLVLYLPRLWASIGEDSINWVEPISSGYKAWQEYNRELYQVFPEHPPSITNGYLLICDWWFGYLKSSKKWS